MSPQEKRQKEARKALEKAEKEEQRQQEKAAKAAARLAQQEQKKAAREVRRHTHAQRDISTTDNFATALCCSYCWCSLFLLLPLGM